ncbi:hypothetical protein FF38_01508 [Lucilia cuprina]|uniref:Receptor ligand binding region domain-containing protein n=1 Tax=Lucilia cuprina TaxID=7375 RepID=A0A0L0CC42_LUCCU|nr:hypothetical protein FF38_01508 [Lucilia cuprina]
MPEASYRPQYAETTTLLQNQMETKVTKTLRVIAQVILTADTQTFYNQACGGGEDDVDAATTSCCRKCKQDEYNSDINTRKDIYGRSKRDKEKDKYIAEDREGAKEEIYICIKPRNCYKQIRTTKTTATNINTVDSNLNCKCKGFPNNNDNSNDCQLTNNNSNNINNKFLNSIISILYCKQFKSTQQQQQQQQFYYTHHYSTANKTCLTQQQQTFSAASSPPHKSLLNYSYKMSQYFTDLFYFVETLLLILTVIQLPQHLVEASCRYEPSRSCEAICQPIWSTTDNIINNNNNNNYQSTVLATNNVTLTNFFPADYNCRIRALVLMPDDDGYVASLKRVVPILQVAEQRIHASGLLPSYIQFDWMPQDDKCDAAFAAVKAMDGIVKNCSHVFFGPVCDYSLAAVGRIAKYFNSNGTPLISVGGSTFDFEKPKTKCSDEFYMLLRTGMLSFESISELTISVMKRHKWSRSIFFYDADGQRNVAGQHTCYLMMTSLGKQMRNENMTFAQYRITEKLKNRTEEITREIGNKNSGK